MKQKAKKKQKNPVIEKKTHTGFGSSCWHPIIMCVSDVLFYLKTFFFWGGGGDGTAEVSDIIMTSLRCQRQRGMMTEQVNRDGGSRLMQAKIVCAQLCCFGLLQQHSHPEDGHLLSSC